MRKREILPILNNAINALVAMSADCAKLEMMDNDQASRRVKRDLASFKQKELREFSDLVYSVRAEMQLIPSRPQTEKQKTNLKPKIKQQHESESTESGNA